MYCYRKGRIFEKNLKMAGDARKQVQPAIECVRKIPLADQSWSLQSPISVPVVIKLLTLCLEDTTFKFRDKFYRMTDGLAMGSPVSPILANIFMDDLERNALVTMKDRPRLWLRYVDDVLSIVKRNSLEGMLVHLNAQNDAITFTKEDENEGKLPFLDGEITRKHARLTLTVYRKPNALRSLPEFRITPSNQREMQYRGLSVQSRRVDCHRRGTEGGRVQESHTGAPRQWLPPAFHRQTSRARQKPH